MKNLEEIVNIDNESQQIIEDLNYDDIISKLEEAKEAGIPIEEGILGAIGGAILGASIGPKLGQAICKALGIDPKGSLGSLMTSRLVLASVCGTMGWRL